MILISYVLEAALALMLAYLGGAFIRNIPGIGDENSGPGLKRDRLLGLALYGVSLFTGGVAGSRLAGIAGREGGPDLSLPLAIPVLGACWLVAVWLGLRKAVTVATVRRTGITAVVTLSLILVFANNRLNGTDIYLLVALIVWLGVTLFWRSHPAK